MSKEEFLLALNKEGLLIYGTTWLENFKRLQELKKYKEMWGELDQDYGEDKLKMTFDEKLNYIMDSIKQRYFPEKKELMRKRLEGLLEVVDELIKALNV